MAEFLLLSILLLILVLLIYQQISLRITYTDEFIIELEFLVFVLCFYPSRNKKKRRSKIKKSFRKINSAKNALAFLLARSDIYIHEINLEVNTPSPSDSVLYTQGIYSVISFIMTYISLKARSVISDDSVFVSEKEASNYKKPTIDISVKTSLSSAILTNFVFLIEMIKKRGLKIVGH